MKKTDRTFKAMFSFSAAALLAVGAATAQVATAGDASFPGAASIDSTGSYRSEVSACNSGMTQQDQATCLREARNAAAEKNNGNLENYRGKDQNAMARCDVHQGAEDRAACQARVLGMGNVDGSVASGGLIRESETVVLPQGQRSVTIQPQTSEPIVLVPSR
jgi:hypothetical protein